MKTLTKQKDIYFKIVNPDYVVRYEKKLAYCADCYCSLGDPRMNNYFSISRVCSSCGLVVCRTCVDTHVYGIDNFLCRGSNL